MHKSRNTIHKLYVMDDYNTNAIFNMRNYTYMNIPLIYNKHYTVEPLDQDTLK